ncbi:hypothetical protein [Nocardia otitidiscaviarum]|uniref:hypothetical protein n=1 Tax=Nocardia otitidiscaviarum TaxID=1823 RepID=UPI0004A6B4F2|nr:hypothetical protein [Nocardia otitidiscaviarum]
MTAMSPELSDYHNARLARTDQAAARAALITGIAHAAFPAHDPESPIGQELLERMVYPLVAPWVDAALSDPRLTITLTEEHSA